jgi:hydroxyacylglutathione hydrolase
MNSDPILIDLGFVNAYLLPAGDGFVLIDTGMPFQWGKLESELRKAGALPDRLKLVVLTHGDMDHTGGCANLHKKYKTPIAIHPGDRDQLATGRQLERESGSRMGKIMVGAMRLGRKLRGQKPMPPPEYIQPEILLSDGQSLAPYGVEATVLHVPGHTPGSIAILAGGLLFAGDTLSNQWGSHNPPFIHNRADLRRSIVRLQGLDAVTIYPGHGKPFPFAEIRQLKI